MLSRFVTLLTSLSCVAAVQPVVDLGYAKYNGTDNGNGVSQWLGMRYARPPVGQLRFAKPQDPATTSGTQPAKKHGLICLGTGTSPASPKYKTESEDCLFLDVYAPTNATSASKLPVFFFIQGGGFVSDANSNYNGTGLIQAGDHDLIVVTFNYRVGSWGFLTDGDTVTANNGLWDQIKALEWVQKHIAKFGGDPNHVVLGGDSAGAGSIAYHLTRDGGKDYGLFVGAAAESISVSTVLTIPESQYLFDGYAKRANCTDNPVSCLRSQPVEVLQAANVNVQPFPGASNVSLFAWNPVIDGTFIRNVTYAAFMSGNVVKVPIIAGDDENGGTIFAPKSTATIPQMNTFLRDQFPYMNLTDLQTIDELFPNPNNTCPNVGCRWRQASNAYQSQRYMCPGLFINEVYTDKAVPSYAYLWNVEDKDEIASGLGVPHTIEVNAVFGPQYTNGGAPKSYYPGKENYHAVEVTQAYWTSFIRTLDPNKHRLNGSAEWGTYSRAGKQRMEFSTGGATAMKRIDDGLDKACEFFYGIGVRIHQ